MDRYNDCTYLLRTQQRCTVLKFLAQFVSKLLQFCYLSIQKMDISLSLSPVSDGVKDRQIILDTNGRKNLGGKQVSQVGSSKNV